MGLSVVGVSHRTAPISLRERFHVPERRMGEFLGSIRSRPGVRECVVLSTCNRTELYLDAEDAPAGREAGEEGLAAHAGLMRVKAERYLFGRSDREAVLHLYRVASGLESMVLGEPQIQGQVGEAYETARRVAPESVGPVMHRLFQTSLSAGGEVRSETAIGEGAASVPSAAVGLAAKVFEELSDRRAVVVGAGEMGRLTLRILLEGGVEEAFVASRTEERAERAAGDVGARPIPYEEVWNRLPETDILVTSTSAPHPLIPAERIREAVADRREPLVILDLSLPRDVESVAGELSGVFLYNVDDLQAAVEGAVEERARERGDAERLLGRNASDFWSWYRAREAVPLIRSLRERAERMRREAVEEELAALESLDEEERKRIRRASRLLVKKVLHAPTVALRQMVEEEGSEALRTARRLFGLEDGGASGEGSGAERGGEAAPPGEREDRDG